MLWLPAALVAMLALCFSLWSGDPVANFGWIESRSGWPEFWRWFSAHFVHLNAQHLLINLAALLALALISQWQGPTPAFWGAFVTAMLAVDAGLAWSGSITWYAGLSGCLHGVFAWLVLRGIMLKRGFALGLWLLFALAGFKALQESFLPVGSRGFSGIPLAPPSHLWGYLGGVAWMLLIGLYNRFAARRRSPDR